MVYFVITTSHKVYQPYFWFVLFILPQCYWDYESPVITKYLNKLTNNTGTSMSIDVGLAEQHDL